MTIRKFKKPCWTCDCDNCGDTLVDFDGIRHWDSKKELLEELKDIDVLHYKKYWFCSEICMNKFLEKRKVVE